MSGFGGYFCIVIIKNERLKERLSRWMRCISVYEMG